MYLQIHTYVAVLFAKTNKHYMTELFLRVAIDFHFGWAIHIVVSTVFLRHKLTDIKKGDVCIVCS